MSPPFSPLLPVFCFPAQGDSLISCHARYTHTYIYTYRVSVFSVQANSIHKQKAFSLLHTKIHTHNIHWEKAFPSLLPSSPTQQINTHTHTTYTAKEETLFFFLLFRFISLHTLANFHFAVRRLSTFPPQPGMYPAYIPLYPHGVKSSQNFPLIAKVRY